MTSTQLKTIFAGLSCFAFTALFAQDTTMKPKTDTSKWPKHDTTKMSTGMQQSIQSNINFLKSIIAFNDNFNDNIVVAKNEMEEEVSTKKYFIKIEA